MVPGPTGWRRVATAATAAVLLGALYVFATQLHGHYPLQDWLFWHYAGHWLLAWAALFLFPGIFLYDSNLSIAADHVLAFWAAPIFLTFLRAWERLEPRRSRSWPWPWRAPR